MKPSDTRGWVVRHLKAFLTMSDSEVIGLLASRSSQTGFSSTRNSQISVWNDQLSLLRNEASKLLVLQPHAGDWTLILEYEIPRRQKRIDAVVLSENVIFSLELKVGASRFERADCWQAEDYALDLRDFHLESRGYLVIPLLVATSAQTLPSPQPGAELDVHCLGVDGLARRIAQLASLPDLRLSRLDPLVWDASPYSPTPSIIQATRQIFSTHSVTNLSHAYADNLGATVAAIQDAVTQARDRGRHTICFITGVPGAGKTLAGMAAVYAASEWNSDDIRGAYLSGNGPLVRILREAVARDRTDLKLKDARRYTEALIQNVHEFLEEYGVRHCSMAPDEDIVVFDEAQRAWHEQKLKQRHKEVQLSEPALMLSVMARKANWSVVVALIGGGQEIHDGEAGLEEWGRALSAAWKPWRVVVSPEALKGGESVASHRLFESVPPSHIEVVEAPGMHLSVSVRSPRARHLAEWVNAILDHRAADARVAMSKIHGFRMGLTRRLDAARAWLRDASRDELQAGLLASSGNLRLRAYGIEMDPQFLQAYPLEHWFLAPGGDVRSSRALEVAMSEFKVQGLELDLVGLCWGDDLTIGVDGEWEMRAFKGTNWQRIKDPARRTYLLNKYRVLLTRAREGLLVWVPPGDPRDPTRDPEKLDRTANLLLEAGLPLIDNGHFSG